MSIAPHTVSVVSGGQTLPGATSYTVSIDILQPADAFSIDLPFSREAWNALNLDAEIGVFLDDTQVMSGFIESREKRNAQGTVIQVAGRDRIGRLIDDAAPEFRYGGLRLKQLCERVAGSVFETVNLVNTENRFLLRNVRAFQAPPVREPTIDLINGIFRNSPFQSPFRLEGPQLEPPPPIIDPGVLRGTAAPKRVTPGMTRWQVLELFLSELRLLAWSTGDGRGLFVGVPNHEQKAQYRFFQAFPRRDFDRRGVLGDVTDRSQETNARIDVRQSNEERYAQITAVGFGSGDERNYGRGRRYEGSVYDNPTNRINGTGVWFERPKKLVVTDDGIKSRERAIERAERERIERDARALEVTVEVAGHSQLYDGDVPAIYAIDTIARVEDEATNLRGDFLVTGVEFTRTRGGGTRTMLRLVPRGTQLSF